MAIPDKATTVKTEQAGLVSVIIPVYNAERYVAEAVESALAQAETGEVLLIEDGSPDNSLAVCERLAAEHERVRLLRHPDGENRGAAEARNLGIENARCPYIAFLDADDYYLPQRFTKALEILEGDTTVDGVYGAVEIRFDTEEMRRWWEERGQASMYTYAAPPAPEDVFATLCGRGPVKGCFHTNGITVRRSLFEQTGLFVPELRMAQDVAMWLKMAAVGRLVAGALDAPIAVQRLHGENRIYRDAEINKLYDLQARSHVFLWALENGLGTNVTKYLVERHLIYQHQVRTTDRTHKRFRLADLPWLIRLAARVPIAITNAYFWHYVLESMHCPLDVTTIRRMKRFVLRQSS